MTAQDVYNIRIKIKRLLPLMNENTDYQSFQDVTNNPKFGAKDLNADNQNVSSDEACNAATTIWSEIMNNHNKSKSDTLICFSEHMELLKMKDKDFSYEILALSNVFILTHLDSFDFFIDSIDSTFIAHPNIEEASAVGL